MSTRTNTLGLAPNTVARHALAAVVALAVFCGSTPAQASPWGVPTSVSRAAAATTPVEAPTTVDGALEAGDLDAAQELATEARKADPSAATWQREGEVLESSGEYGKAGKAYRAAAKAAEESEDAEALAAAEDGLTRVKAASRGTVADEPESTHREQLDERWAPPAPPPKPEPKPEPVPIEDKSDRIVTKWYFWVTVGAIAASAAAVTAIAIRAAREDQPDALDSLVPAPPARGVGVLRF